MRIFLESKQSILYRGKKEIEKYNPVIESNRNIEREEMMVYS